MVLAMYWRFINVSDMLICWGVTIQLDTRGSQIRCIDYGHNIYVSIAGLGFMV